MILSHIHGLWTALLTISWAVTKLAAVGEFGDLIHLIKVDLLTDSEAACMRVLRGPVLGPNIRKRGVWLQRMESAGWGGTAHRCWWAAVVLWWDNGGGCRGTKRAGSVVDPDTVKQVCAGLEQEKWKLRTAAHFLPSDIIWLCRLCRLLAIKMDLPFFQCDILYISTIYSVT